METLQIDLIDPSVRKILDELAANNRIKIIARSESVAKFLDRVKQLRQLEIDISEDEILSEVKAERAKNQKHG